MKTLIAALALLSLAAGPVFAASSPSFPHSNYWVGTDDPDFTGP
jgi:hypothetical protein